MYLLWAFLLLLAALLLLGLSTRQRRGLGVPEGRVLYSDNGAEHRLSEPLFDDELLLVGKPDYLVENAQGLVPIEVKSGRTPARPFASHIYQLAAYCLLVQRNFKRRPVYGIIRYPERTFTVEFTPDLERRALALLDDMRTSVGGELHRSHQKAGRCRSCGFLALCDESI